VWVAISNIVEEGFMGLEENEGVDIFPKGDIKNIIQCFALLSIGFFVEKWKPLKNCPI
jgi:hypothetical protein